MEAEVLMFVLGTTLLCLFFLARILKPSQIQLLNALVNILTLPTSKFLVTRLVLYWKRVAQKISKKQKLMGLAGKSGKETE